MKTKKEMLGKKYELLVKSEYWLEDSDKKVTFYPGMIFEVQDAILGRDENAITLVTYFAGIEYRVPYFVNSISKSGLWREVE